MAVMRATLTLNTGVTMPVIGLGTWKSKRGEACEAVKTALDNGYRHIDCAYAYANEEDVGNGIAAKLEDKTTLRRDLFITSKLAPTYNDPERVEEGCRASLKNLGLDYLDLYLMHWPVALQEAGGLLEDIKPDYSYVDTWKEMEKLVDLKLVKAIGVSNFNMEQLQEILNVCRIKPAVNQIEVHPCFSNTELVDFCKDNAIIVTAFAPFGSPDPLRPTIKDDDEKPLEKEEIIEIGKAHGKTPGQVILQWLLQRGVTAIPKSVTPKRIKANIELADFLLTEDEMKKINDLNCNFRACIGAPFVNSKFYPFKKKE